MQRYAAGEWDSLWPGDPYRKHRFVLDLSSRAVIAGADRIRRCWRPMRLEHVSYMHQTLNETFARIWDEPDEFDFLRTAEIPEWATQAWARPPLPEVEDRADDLGYAARFSWEGRLVPALANPSGAPRWK